MPSAPPLIIGSLVDPHVATVAALLERRGVRACLIDPAEPAPAKCRVVFDRDSNSVQYEDEHGYCDLSTTRSVWYRYKPALIDPHPDTTVEQDERFARSEWRAFIRGLSALLTSARWMNLPDLDPRIEYKIGQLAHAKRCGLVVPHTIIGNDKRALSDFDHTDTIYKPLESFVWPDGSSIFTSAVNLDELSEGSIRRAPGIYQRRLRKRREFRVTIVGASVFTAVVNTPEGSDSLDWRRAQWRNSHEIAALPHAATAGLLAFHSSTGLLFGAYDLIEELDGTVVFLECNPMGQYLWLERILGLPISAAIADFLAS